MKIRNSLLMVAFELLALSLSAYSADSKRADTESTMAGPAKVPVQQASAPTTRSKSAHTTTAAISPQSGEQIKWQVLAGGRSASSSTNYQLSATLGQPVIGGGTSTKDRVSQGYWQNFSTSCCVGKRGNVNGSGIIDLVDLSSLVNYLIGGGYMLPCPEAANINGTGIIDLVDLSSLVNYLTGGGYVLPSCP